MQKYEKQTIGEALKPEKGAVIAIVGAGGKTSLMYGIALSTHGRRVVATTTRIYEPCRSWNTYIGVPVIWQRMEEIVVAGREIVHGKLMGFDPSCLKAGYDLLLLEGDGSRRLSLKGWGPEEPVILRETTMTIGVLDVTTLGMPIDSDHIFRLDAFRALGNHEEKVTLDCLARLVCHKKGLFKHSRGRRILFMNKVEGMENVQTAKALVEKIDKLDCAYPIDRILIGSALEAWAERLR